LQSSYRVEATNSDSCVDLMTLALALIIVMMDILNYTNGALLNQQMFI